MASRGFFYETKKNYPNTQRKKTPFPIILYSKQKPLLEEYICSNEMDY